MPDDLIEKIILLTIAIAILFYSFAYVILPAFNVTYNASVTGLSSSLLQGLMFLLFLIIMFAFVLLVIYTVIKRD